MSSMMWELSCSMNADGYFKRKIINKNDIASAAQCVCNSVQKTLEEAKVCGFQGSLPVRLSDKELEEKLIPNVTGK